MMDAIDIGVIILAIAFIAYFTYIELKLRKLRRELLPYRVMGRGNVVVRRFATVDQAVAWIKEREQMEGPHGPKYGLHKD